MDKINKLNSKKLNITKIILLVFITIGIILLVLLRFTKSTTLDELVTSYDKPLEPGSTLTYYLDITYDGVDREGVESSDTTLSKIYSDYIYVEDKIPNGLIFQEFDTTSFMSYAEPQGNIEKVCAGQVYDDSNGATEANNYKGLHYDSETRTVNFRVKDLQAGCHLIIGIVTKIPDTVDDPETTDIVETRRDFWNSAKAWEGVQSVNSNLVHAWIESQEATLYQVTYQYDSSAPPNAPEYSAQEYVQGANVDLAPEPSIEGYKFLGWTIVEGLSTSITNHSFTMPNNNVVIQGRFEKIPKDLVLYEIEGEIPEGYVLPEAKEYYRNSTVVVDSMKKNDTFNGYKFSGWTTEDVAIEDGQFIMPEHNVTLKGKFEVIKYKVEYQYQGANVPEGVTPPATQEYAPGESVTLPHVSDVGGYTFLSWDKADGFIMPAEDTIVYGEWRVKTETFSLAITKEIINKKDLYYMGDVVEYKITVTNPATYPIKNIQVKENNPNAKFISDGTENYKIKSDHIAEIVTIPAGDKVTMKAQYIVTDNDAGTITNEVEIIGALAETYYTLDTTKEYKDTAEFYVQSKIKVCNTSIDDKTNQVYQFHMTSTDKEFETWINLANNECETMYVDSKEYQITEILPQSYELDSIVYSSNLNGVRENNKATFTIGKDANYEITFNNKYLKKGYYHSNGRMINRVLKKKMVKVTYKDGVSGTAFRDQVYEVEEGSSTPAYSGTPSRLGYTFTGWSPYISELADADIVYTAQWSQSSIKATVTFDSNGGSSVEPVEVNIGGTVSMPADPVRAGYSFGGWTLNGSEYDFSTPVTDDIVLVAQWSQNSTPGLTYQVTFKWANDESVTYRVSRGETVTAPQVPSYINGNYRYTFSAWSPAFDSSAPVTRNVTYNAQYNSTLINSGGGSTGGGGGGEGT